MFSCIKNPEIIKIAILTQSLNWKADFITCSGSVSGLDRLSVPGSGNENIPTILL